MKLKRKTSTGTLLILAVVVVTTVPVACGNTNESTLTDPDSESDTETGTGTPDCPGYPDGPYHWYLDYTAPSNSEFPAMYGTQGEETVLNMCDVWNNKDTIKALVFAIGSSD